MLPVATTLQEYSEHALGLSSKELEVCDAKLLRGTTTQFNSASDVNANQLCGRTWR